MPVFMKYPDIEGRINEADRFDFSQLTTSHDVDDGLLLVGLRWGQPVVDDGLLLPAVQDEGLLLPAVQDDGLLLPAVQTDYGLLLPY